MSIILFCLYSIATVSVTSNSDDYMHTCRNKQPKRRQMTDVNEPAVSHDNIVPDEDRGGEEFKQF